MKIKKILLIILVSITSVHASKFVLGDRTDTTNSDSFSFDLLTKSVFDAATGRFYVANNDAAALTGDQRKYALAGAVSTGTQFTAGAPETVTLDGTADQSNPLFGARIAQLGVIGGQPLAIKNDDQDAIYWVTSTLGVTPQTMLSVTSINDANAAASPGVVVVSDNAHGCTLTGSGSTLFAAVKPNGGNFGSTNGGIAVFTKTAEALTQEKAVSGDDTNVKAVGIGVATDALKITGDLTSLVANAVDMHWDSVLGRLFVAVRINDGGDDGARAVLMGRVVANSNDNGKKLIFNGIAPTSAFTAATDIEIVGGTTANIVADIYRVRTMHPTSGGSYLIVQGNSSETNASTSLYCLPLVNEAVNPAKSATWATSSTHATLAKKSITLTDYYTNNIKSVPVFTKRAFATQASAANDLLNETDDAKRVLIGGTVVPGTVSDVQVYRDTVFVSTNAGAGSTFEGIFYSQALFDADGVIVAWTSWQRVAYPLGTNVIEGFGYVPTLGQLFTVEGAVTAPQVVKITDWGSNALNGLLGGTTTDSSVGMLEKVTAQFSQDNGGVMGLFDFNASNEAFVANNLSLMVATGYKKVVIIKTSAIDTGLIATTGDFTTAQRTFTSGAISNTSTEGAGVTSTTEIISVSGGDLDDLGAITSAAIVEDGTHGGYLAVGGTGGLALLRKTGRTGWATTGILADLSHADSFSTDKSFQKIGTYSNVRKLWTAKSTAGTQVLYVLTDVALFRIDATNLNEVTPTVSTIATLAGLNLPTHASFADFVASRTLGLLATSDGLYRTGNGNNVSTAANTSAVGWVKVSLNSDYTGVSKLIPLSSTVQSYEFANSAPGQVYAITSSVSLKNSVIHRLAIKNSATAVDATTVQLVSNPKSKDINNVVLNTPFSYLGVYRNVFATNGATLLAGASSYLTNNQHLKVLPNSLKVGVGFSASLEKAVDLNLSATASDLFGIERNSATGSWLVYGDFGLRSLE